MNFQPTNLWFFESNCFKSNLKVVKTIRSNDRLFKNKRLEDAPRFIIYVKIVIDKSVLNVHIKHALASTGGSSPDLGKVKPDVVLAGRDIELVLN